MNFNDALRELVATVEGRMREIAEDAVRNQSLSTCRADSPEASELQAQLQLIMVKEFISAKEAALLLSCSGGHIRNLVDKARKGKTVNPIPFCDLDGVTAFRRVELIKWTEARKPKLKAVS